MRIVILAAGVGSRLGNPYPKSLTVLEDGRSILQRQLDNLAGDFDPALVSIVVGFKKDMIMEAFPNVTFVYNQDFGETNTCKSLLKGLRLSGPGGTLWMNADVVFEPSLLQPLLPLIARDQSFVAVNTAAVADEEVKYRLDGTGYIAELSKQVVDAAGEAVGINYVSALDKPYLIARLEDCDPTDYFERGIELAIEKDGRRFVAVDVSDSLCIEVDFLDDLERANQAVGGATHDDRSQSTVTRTVEASAD